MLVLLDRAITRHSPPWIIAEAGVNHNGDVAAAHLLLEMAARAGADAVKYQFFKAEELATQLAPLADYQRQHIGSDHTQLEMLMRLQLPHKCLHELCDHAHELSLAIGITPFDDLSLAAVAASEVDFIKVGSGDCNNYPFLRRVAQAGKPVILSSGMATAGEVMRAAAELGDTQHALLHCVSAYPAPEEEQNLLAIKWLQRNLSCPIGYSDHTTGTRTAQLAAALGAVIFEKHITLDNNAHGPDHRCSLEEEPLRRYIKAVRSIATILGDGVKRPVPSELETRLVARRSVTAARRLEAGTIITAADLCLKRPGSGIPPAGLDDLIGQRIRCTVAADSQLAPEHLETVNQPAVMA